MNDDSKRIKRNMVINAVKSIVSIIVPLITFPYVSNVLGVDNIGRYGFATSIINYFSLFAGLGINTYAVREGSVVRKNREKFNKFANEIFSINMISTCLSYLFLFGLFFFFSNISRYKSLLIILSVQIIFKTIGVEWVYSVYEEYMYITIRSIIFKILSILLIYMFVKTVDDTNTYSIIIIISILGPELWGFIRSRKYCAIRFTTNINIQKHIKPIIVLFAMSATIVVYVSSDITLLGMMCSDYTVGIYSVSVKIYGIIKTILSSILIVSIPRLAALLGNENKKGFISLAEDVYKTLISVVMPAIVGILVLRREIVFLISSSSYESATSSLALLSVSLFFCLGAWFWGQCIMIPFKKERSVFRITILSALINIVLNIFLIPLWKENAAAFTTIVAEALSFVLCDIEGRKLIKLGQIWPHYLKVLTGCIAISLIGLFVQLQGYSCIITLIIVVPVSIIIYLVIELCLKNESFIILKSIILSHMKDYYNRKG